MAGFDRNQVADISRNDRPTSSESAAWLEFFLDGVARTAGQAFEMSTRIVNLFEKDRATISAAGRTGSALRLHQQMQKNPFLTAPKARELTGLTTPTVNAAFGELQRLGIVTEVTGRSRGRVYCYKAYVDLLNDSA